MIIKSRKRSGKPKIVVIVFSIMLIFTGLIVINPASFNLIMDAMASSPTNETFEDEAEFTSPPANWTNDSGFIPDGVDINTTHAHGGVNSMWVNDSGVGMVYKDIEIKSESLVIWFYPADNTSQYQFVTHIDTGGWSGGADVWNLVRFNTIGEVYYRDHAATYVLVSTYTGGNWIKLEITPDLRNQTYDLEIDDVLLVDDERSENVADKLESVTLWVQGEAWFDDITTEQIYFSGSDDLPNTLELNAKFSDEGNNNTQWGVVGSYSASDGILTIPQNTILYNNFTFPEKDNIIYIKLMNSDSAGYYCNLSIQNIVEGRLYDIFFGYNVSNSTAHKYTISAVSGGVEKVFTDSLDLSVYNELVLNYDQTWQDLNIYSRTLSTFTYLDSLELNTSTIDGEGTALKRLVFQTPNIAGSSYIDYLSVCWPNIIAIGDSITAGHGSFNPDSAHFGGKDWYNHSYESYVNVYPGCRNTFIINKGIGGDRQDEIYTNIPNLILENRPVICILQSSNNDYGIHTGHVKEGIVQNCTDLLREAPFDIKVILTDAIVPNNNHGSHPGIATYYKDWNVNRSGNITNCTIASSFNSTTLKNATGELSSIYDGGDGIHLNVLGYALFGNFIESVFPTIVVNIQLPTSGYEIRKFRTLTSNWTSSGPILWYIVDWGDSNTDNTTLLTLTHGYDYTGSKTITVSAFNGTHFGFDTVTILVTSTVTEELGEETVNSLTIYIPLLITIIFAVIIIGSILELRKQSKIK